MADVNETKQNDTMQYILGEPDYFGVANRSRRIGERGNKGEKDTREQIRFGWRVSRVVPLTKEQAEDPRQQLVDLQAARYINVDMAKKLAIFNGKTESELTDDELRAYNGQTIEVDLATIAPLYMEEFYSSEGQERGAVEPEYKAVAAFYRAAKLGAAKQALEAGDTARSEALTVDSKWFTAANIRAVYLGTYSGDCSEERSKAITKKVDAYKKTSETDANI